MEMKKLIFILLAATAFSCGDGNRSSERESDDMNNDLNNRELVEPDTTGMTDTTSTYQNTDGDLLQQDTVQ